MAYAKDVEALCAALAANTSLTELNASGRKLHGGAAGALAAMLTRNIGLRRLAVGDATLGDEVRCKRMQQYALALQLEWQVTCASQLQSVNMSNVRTYERSATNTFCGCRA